MLHYQHTGNGKIIVFIHGSSHSSQVWSTMFKESALLAYTLISIDLPGHGLSFRSANPEMDYTLKGLAAKLEEFLAALKEEYIVVANSIASNLIAEVITKLPQCKGVFLIGPSVIGKGFSVSKIVKPNPYFGITFAAYPSDEELKDYVSNLALQSEAGLKTSIQMFRDTDPAMRVQLGESISQEEWSDEIANLEKLKYPVGIIYGEDEKFIFSDYLGSSKINMWRNSIIKLQSAGHCPQLDQPGQLADLINQYAADIFRSADS